MSNTRWTLVGLLISLLLAILAGVIVQLIVTERMDDDSAEATRTILAQTAISVEATVETLPIEDPFSEPPQIEPTSTNADLLFELANDWPLVAYDSFDDNRRGWSTGGNGTYSRGEREIDEGIYRWQLTAIEGFYWWTAPISAPFDNLYAAVTIDKTDRNTGDTSLVFRYADGDNYYEFGLCDSSTEFRVAKETDGTRSTIVACQSHPSIRKQEWNRIAVLAQTDRYLLFINEQHVHTFDDNDHSRGGVGVGLDMDESQANVFEFDDIVVRSADIDQ